MRIGITFSAFDLLHGGAGFIRSNIIEYLIKCCAVNDRVLYNHLNDIKHSKAKFEKISKLRKYEPNVFLKRGLGIVFEYYKTVNN